MLAHLRIQESLLEEMKSHIEEASGNEVLWWGKLDENSLVAQVEVAARGNEDAVPALFPHMVKGDVVIHNHPSGLLQPSPADLSVASQLGNQGIGFYIVDNSLQRLYAVAEPLKQRGTGPLDIEEVASYLEPNGPLSKFLDNYEPREPQVEMLKMVTQGFNEDRVVAAEAGTGVGKSFAYLIPAMLWAHQNQERVVVSTATINLQQQLLEKDIPLVKKLLGKDIKAVLVKGRGNYVCLKRLNEAWEEESLFRDKDDELHQLKEWAYNSKDGSRSDLSFQPQWENWTKINSEADLCSGIRCSHYEHCFVMLARKEAASASLLVTNHHLLFADLSLRLNGFGFEAFAVLPPFQRIIFDEAHNIEKAATSFFSRNYSRFALLRHMNRIYRNGRGGEKGLLKIWERRVSFTDEGNQIPGLIREILGQADTLDTLVMDFNPFQGSMAVEGPVDRNLQFGILDPMQKLQNTILKLLHAMSDLMKRLPEGCEEEDFVIEWNQLRSRLEGLAQFFQDYQDYQKKQDEIFWLEKKGNRKGQEYLQFYITPLDIAPLMKEAVFDPFPSVISTSATLSVAGNFNYWLKRSGASLCDEDRLALQSFPSPFNYKDQVLLSIPKDVPFPTDQDQWMDYCLPLIMESLMVSQGKALLLFTSYHSLMRVYDYLHGPLEQQGISIYRQGEEDRSKLLERFKGNLSSVLLATDSFWEGVDVPGDSLRLVIISRLPFRVPSDPVIKARMNNLERQGGNAFRDMSLPDAIMRFKQGFGRLMRAHSDGGVVLVLDGRVLRKNYGQAFLRSLPETGRSIGTRESIVMNMENFLYG